jgi:hypothetical protein
MWLYLFFLPFHLIRGFRWSSIVGIGITVFIYLGFLTAREELLVSDTIPHVINIKVTIGLIEYNVNDLDLNLFTSKSIHKDIIKLKRMHCFNIYHSHQFNGRKIKSISDIVPKFEEAGGCRGEFGQ